MFATCAANEAEDLAYYTYRLGKESLLHDVGSYVREHRQHLIGELLPESRRVEPEKLAINRKHRSSLLQCDTKGSQARDVLHSVDFKLQISTSLLGQPIGLTPAR